MRRELNVLALIKGEERYVFVYDDLCREDLLDTIRQFASEPEMSLSWFDAAVLTERARQQAKQTGAEPETVSSLPPRSRGGFGEVAGR